MFSEQTLVINRRDLLSAIQSLCDKPVLTDEQVQQIKTKLEVANITDPTRRRNHKYQVRITKELSSSDLVFKAYNEGKDSPILHFTPQPTREEQFLRESLDTFHTLGPMLMKISYKPLWKLLIDRDMKKKDLCDVAGIRLGTQKKESLCVPVSDRKGKGISF